MKPVDAQFVAWLLWIAATICWIVSLVTPAFQTIDGASTYGIQILLVGWMSLLFLVPAWLSNVLIVPVLVGWNHMSPRGLRTCSVIASLLSFTWFIFPARGGLPVDEGTLQIQRYQVGMYLWLTSFILAAIGAHMRLAFEKNE